MPVIRLQGPLDFLPIYLKIAENYHLIGKEVTVNARIVSLVIAALWALPALAGDTVERSCKAAYRLHLSAIEDAGGTKLIPIADVIGGVANPDGSFGFSARRGCGATVPDRCRRRAGEAAMACMQAHASARGTMPRQCTSDGVTDYQITNLETVVRGRACEEVRKRGINESILPRPYYIKVTIKGMVYGDSGCAGGDRNTMERDLAALRVACPVN